MDSTIAVEDKGVKFEGKAWEAVGTLPHCRICHNVLCYLDKTTAKVARFPVSNERRFSMASADNSTPTCPVCHQADQVKTTQAAYTSGVARCAPPDMPTRNISMLPYIGAGVVLIGILVFLIITLVASGGMATSFMGIFLSITVVCIIGVLALSFYAFQRVVRGDAETTLQFPAWDSAMATWRSLYYCSRDDVVFDTKANKVVTSEQFATLRASGEKVARRIQQSALASH
jgi:hypothetical protein